MTHSDLIAQIVDAIPGCRDWIMDCIADMDDDESESYIVELHDKILRRGIRK